MVCGGGATGIKIWTEFSFVLSQCTRLTHKQTDGQTDRPIDRQTEFSSLDRVCIPCSAVKTVDLTASDEGIPTEGVIQIQSNRDLLNAKLMLMVNDGCLECCIMMLYATRFN